MSEKPILFSAPMVRALLAGTKTQTRRALRGFLPPSTPEYDSESGRLEWFDGDDVVVGMRCPYGQPGTKLWVRETFGHFERNDTLKPGDTVYYRADGECLELEPWRPSIHMPRWASRITLEITGVRVERLQDISEADAQAEGCAPRQPLMAGGIVIPGQWRLGYRDLWESINGPGSWDANPFVWVVEFKRLEGAA